MGNEAIYLNFADYAAEAFEFVSYVAGCQVDEFLFHMAARDNIYGVKMSLTFHAIFYHINSDGTVDYRIEVHDQMAQNERGQNMVMVDVSTAFKFCFNTCVELYNHCLQCLNPEEAPVCSPRRSSTL